MVLDRVFIDTNILVSAVAFGGNERDLLVAGLGGRFVPVLAEFVLRETRRVLRVKFPARAVRFEWLLVLLDYELVAAPPDELLRKASGILRDPGDVTVLASIMHAKPDVALTGDKDLLTDEVKAIAPVCTCAEYLRRRSQ